MMPGMPERRTHDYVRPGTTTLFAALEVATGKVIGSLHRRHRAVEFKKFLTKLDKEVPADLDVHLIWTTTPPTRPPTIKNWLVAHPRFHLHFTPTGSSWLNLVERWFGLLTDKQIRRGVHKAVPALENDIRDWIDHLERGPKTVRLDQDRRRDPRTPRHISTAHSAQDTRSLSSHDTRSWKAIGRLGSRSATRATASASMGSDLPRSRADSRVRAIRCGRAAHSLAHGPAKDLN